MERTERGDAVASLRAAEIDQRGLQDAVRNNDQIVRGAQEICRSTIGLNDLTLDPITERQPIADPVGSAGVKRDSREDVAQGALQREAEDDREHARGGDERSDRRVEDVGDDG